MSYLSNKISLIGLVAIMAIPFSVRADWFNDFSVNYSDCNGRVTIRFLAANRETCGFQDRIGWLSLKTNTGTEFFFMDGNTHANRYSGMTLYTLLNENGTCDAHADVYTRSGASFALEYSNNLIYGVVTYDDLPDSYFGSSSTPITLNGWYDHVPGGGQEFGTNVVRSGGSQGTIGNPSLNSVTTDLCDRRTISWSNSNGSIGSCSNSTKFTYIERRLKGSSSFSHLTSVAFPATSYNDTDGLPGQEFEYRVYHRFAPNAFRGVNSDYSNILTGKKQGYPAAPTNFTASRATCNRRINLTWNNVAQATQYSISRNGSFLATTNTTSYEDTSPPLDVDVTYTIHSIDGSCNLTGITTASSIGFAANIPTGPSTLTATKTPTGIVLTWPDASTMEDGYVLERTFSGGGGALIIDLPPNSTTHTDADVNQCVTYTYKIKTKTTCFPNGVGTATASTRIEADLSNAFPADTGFIASKGYFTDKVELTWINNNAGQTNTTKIFRRVLGSGNPFALLTTLSGGSGIYNDVFAEAAVLYEYEILAEGPCENDVTQSNRVGSIGFRIKSGQVSGKVFYTGGIAVEGVKIIGESTTGPVGGSLNMNGGTLTIADKDNQDLSNQVLLETWVRPASYAGNMDIFRRNGSFRLT